MKVENVYTAISCNTQPDAMDWGPRNLVAFGAQNYVAIMDTRYHNNSCKIIATLIRHKERVNVVKWVWKNSNSDTTELISASEDGCCVLWDIQDIEAPKLIVFNENKHRSVVGLHYIFHDDALIVASCNGINAIVWKQDPETKEFKEVDKLNRSAFNVRLHVLLDSGTVILAIGCADARVFIYLHNEYNVFEEVCEIMGHDDWVRGLDIIQWKDYLLLASSSQDKYIRIYKITKREIPVESIEDRLEFSELDDDDGSSEAVINVGTKDDIEASYIVRLDSVLLGHDGWVYSVKWNISSDGKLQLLSASLDKALAVWRLGERGLWLDTFRMGTVSGGNSLGFYGGNFSPDGKSVIGHSFDGSFHIWHQDTKNKFKWKPGIVTNGHFGRVRDLEWDPKGEFLVTVSTDQTTRIHAPWRQENGTTVTWHEIARPQLHGYDMQCLAVISRYRFVSGAEEKIARVFEAPANFVENFRRITKSTIPDPDGDEILKKCTMGASVPTLGLSNKAVLESQVNEQEPTDDARELYPDQMFKPIDMIEPPNEEDLLQKTLFPEVSKLYGHGYELYAIGANPDGTVIASSCKAANAEQAQVILWNTTTWKILDRLSPHQLTATQLKFSPCGKYLLTVSRDRTWVIFENRPTNEKPINFQLEARSADKKSVHSRIIWTCDWSHDSKYFGTGSRDGKIGIWSKADMDDPTAYMGYKNVDVIEMKNESITAMSFIKFPWAKDPTNYYLAIGTEQAKIVIFKFDGKLHMVGKITSMHGHSMVIRKLAFNPNPDNGMLLASCSDDHFVRIYRIDFSSD